MFAVENIPVKEFAWAMAVELVSIGWGGMVDYSLSYLLPFYKAPLLSPPSNHVPVNEEVVAMLCLSFHPVISCPVLLCFLVVYSCVRIIIAFRSYFHKQFVFK